MDPGAAPASRSQRLFLALWPDEGVRKQLITHAGQWIWPSACTRYAPADWHVTLHFIGHVDADRVVGIAARAAVPIQPFQLILDQPGLWQHGLAVLCASEVPPALRALYDQLGDALHGLDLSVDTRPYQPHITLARRAAGAILPMAPAPVVWPVSNFALVVSVQEKGHRYQVIRRYH